jgi:hypothetical protein
MRRWTILNVLLGVIVALLGIEIVRTWARAVPSVDLTPRPPAPAREAEKHVKGKRGVADKTGAHAEPTPAVMVAAIADKDLFDPSRRGPNEDAATPVAHETGPPPGINVVGIRILGRDREVFVTDASQGNQQRRLRPGDQVGGYTVKSIEATGLVLVSPSGDAVNMALSLEKGKPPAAHPGAPAPVAKPPAAVQAAKPAQVSPAAGAQGASTAAGIAVKPAGPGAPTPGPAAMPAGGAPGAPATSLGKPVGTAPGQNPQLQKLPNDVRQKLEQLKEKEGQGSHLGRKR